tara:strand:+ start:548 stop:799 length:252 start_codon:yes stop_codon:yes gene_type:complete
MSNQFQEVVEALEFLKEDPMTVRKVKEKADLIIQLLNQTSDSNVDQALRELEELDSSEIPSYDRTQIWDVVSMLESVSLSIRI